MNDQLAAVVCQDAYADALTLGPFAGVMDGLDLSVAGAAVLAQFARSVPTGVQPWSDKEYLLRPGSRSIDNVCGARFRNAIAGVPAVVTASQRGPDQPQVGQVFAGTPIIGPPILAPQTVQLSGGGAAQVFAGQTPADYTNVLVWVQTLAHPCWVEIAGGIPVPINVNVTGVINPATFVYVPVPAGSYAGGLYAVFPVNANALEIFLSFGTANDSVNVAAWPTNLPAGTYLPPGGNIGAPLFNSVPSPVLVPNVAQVFDMVPFFGPATLLGANFSAQPHLLEVVTIDVTGNQIGVPLFATMEPLAAGLPGTTQQAISLPPGRNKVVLENLGSANSQINVSIIGNYAGLAG